MLRLPLAVTSEAAQRFPESVSARIMAAGRVEGEWVLISKADYAKAIRKPMGLGDLVASVAQPIAGAIDAVLGTNVKGCGGCKKRQEALNRLVPKL